MDMTTETVPLDQPIKRGETLITELVVRKPKTGELRGLKLVDLLQMDTDAVIKVLPRVTTPTLTQSELYDLDPADLTSLASTVVGFLLSQGQRELASRTA